MAGSVLRTCVGCRQAREQRELVRLAADPATGVVVNPPRRPQTRGRGAYLCPSLACLQKAWGRKVFPRAFRQELPGLREDVIRKRFEAELRRRGGDAGQRVGPPAGDGEIGAPVRPEMAGRPEPPR
jgi:hypothetical protein